MSYAIATTANTGGLHPGLGECPGRPQFHHKQPRPLFHNRIHRSHRQLCGGLRHRPFHYPGRAQLQLVAFAHLIYTQPVARELGHGGYSSDGVISYTVSSTGNTAGCSLASSGAPVMLSFSSAGSCTIDAGLAASTSYTSVVPIAQVFTIGLVAQTISFTTSSPASPVVGATYLPAAMGGGSGNPVTFSIDNSSASVCSISSGTVTFNAVGNCLIDADQAGNSSYAAATELTQTVTVTAIPQAITFTTTAPTGATAQGTYSPAATGGGWATR